MPPPPPPAPPPPPGGGPSSAAFSASPKGLDRNALLGEIRLGTRLKHAETNDRSNPLIDGGKKPSNVGSAVGVGPAFGESKGNGPSSHNTAAAAAPMGLGGLFAQGMPKLRPAGTRGQAQKTGSATMRVKPTEPPASIVSHNWSNQASPLPVIKNSLNNSSWSRPSFPNDLGQLRGGPPPPPSSNHKPMLMNGNRPPPPSKPPGVTLPSHNGQGPYRNGPHHPPTLSAPSSRPPPPPKMANVNPGGNPPALPTKPPDLLRRKSFGGPDLRNGHSSMVASRPHPPKSICPPPPPRNVSVPDSLNHLNGQRHHHDYPPPPPPPPSVPPQPPPASAKQGMMPGRSMPNLAQPPPIKHPNVRPPPPPSRNLGAPPPPPSGAPPPPPPPPHRMGPPPVAPPAPKSTAPMPPNNVSMMNEGPPMPPMRIGTPNMPRHVKPDPNANGNYEERLRKHCRRLENLPLPPNYGNVKKPYPSKEFKNPKTSQV